MIIHYIIPRVLKRNFNDEYVNKTENKYGYLKRSILSNINKLKNNEIIWDDELCWFKELGDEIEEEIEI